MRLLPIGYKYAGKYALSVEIPRWCANQNGKIFQPPSAIEVHDHFILPHVVHAIGHGNK